MENAITFLNSVVSLIFPPSYVFACASICCSSLGWSEQEKGTGATWQEEADRCQGRSSQTETDRPSLPTVSGKQWLLPDRNELSEETHGLTKQETLLRMGTRGENSRAREPRRTALHVACSLRFYGNGVSFWVVSGRSLWLSILPGGAWVTQPGWISAIRIMGCW